MIAAAASGASIADLTPSPSPDRGEAAGMSLTALETRRSAEPFERLRDRAEAIEREQGLRPMAFRAKLGSTAEFNARASFAANAFAAGGIAAPLNDGFADRAAMVDAFRRSGARLACLCSSDAVYAVKAEQAARALKEAGCGALYLAGRPADLEAQLREAGVDVFIHAGMDLVAMLEDAFRRM